MLDLNNNQTLQLAMVLDQLDSFNEKRYQNITSALANAIANARDDRERDSFVAILQLVSAVWYGSEIISEAKRQVDIKAEE